MQRDQPFLENLSPGDPCRPGGLSGILWCAARSPLRNDAQPYSSLGIPFRRRVLSDSGSGPPQRQLPSKDWQWAGQALFPQGRTSRRVISGPKRPVDLAEVFAVIQKQFNSPICQNLLPVLLHRGWSWKLASKSCLHVNLCLWGFFLENLKTLSKDELVKIT